MGIRLDWEIQAEQAQVQNAGEDPQAARIRRRARFRLILIILTLLVLSASVVFAAVMRLREVDSQIEQLLRDTVSAEVAALRIGDYQAFASLQRSASSEWLLAQKTSFDQYQDLKIERDLQLTGRVAAVEVSKARGRVQVEEIIDGVPYTRVWFYWRYEDGWHHVPPDYTFWGDSGLYVGDGVRVNYLDVDNTLAVEMGLRVKEWRQLACAALDCGELSEITIQIAPSATWTLGWASDNPWQLNVPSPYMDRARSDMPFDIDMQFQTASLLAERFVKVASKEFQPVYPADAWYLRQAVINWLVGKFVRINTNSFLVESLAANYGEQAVGLLIQFMQPDSNINILSLVTGTVSLDQINVDWRDLLTWRLATERDLLEKRDLAGFLSLYASGDEAVRTLAMARFESSSQFVDPVVVFVLAEVGEAGSPQLRANVQFKTDSGLQETEVLFRLVDNIWRRVS